MFRKRASIKTAVTLSWLCLFAVTLLRLIFTVAGSRFPLKVTHSPIPSPEQLRFISSFIQGVASLLIQLLIALAFHFEARDCVFTMFLVLLVDRICHAVPQMTGSILPAENVNYRLFLLEAVILLVYADSYRKDKRSFASVWWIPAAVTLCRTAFLISAAMSESGRNFFTVAVQHYEYLLTAVAFAFTGHYLQADVPADGNSFAS